MRNLIASTLAATALVALPLGLAACGSDDASAPATTSQASQAGRNAAGAGPSCLPNCSGADLSGERLTGLELYDVDFSGANLTDAVMKDTFLDDANLSGANLTDATLDSASLARVNLTGANLTRTDLSRADLRKATLTGVTWNDTTCPNGTVTSTGC